MKLEEYNKLPKQKWVEGPVYSIEFDEYFCGTGEIEEFEENRTGKYIEIKDMDIEEYQLVLCEKEPLRLIYEDFFDTIKVYDDWELDDDIKDAMKVFNKVVEKSRCNNVYFQIKIAAIIPM